MMKNYKIEITSMPDREHLVAEIWYEDQMIAELNQEEEALELQFYEPITRLSLNFKDLNSILAQAEKKLTLKTE